MMRIVQSLAIGSVGSEFNDEPLARRYASLEGLAYDLMLVEMCIERIDDVLSAPGRLDDFALAAFTWHAVVLYARCFDDGAEGRNAAVGARALRGLTDDERALHDGLLDVRNRRFAHAGQEARHRCVLALFERDGRSWLSPGFEIETPTGMFDPAQVALFRAIVQKLRGHTDAQVAAARAALEQHLHAPNVGGPISERLRTQRRHATPEAQALAILAGNEPPDA